MGYYYPSGLSNKSGAYSLMRGKVYTSRPVLYVHSDDGNDANGGTSYLRPKATLQSAVDASNGDHTIIVLKSGSSESVSTAIDLAGKPVTVVGESLVGADPDAELEPAAGLGSGSILTTAGSPDGVELANIRILPRGASSGIATMVLAGDHDAVRDCQFQCGEHDGGLLDIGNDYAFVSACKFESAESTANSNQIPALEGSGTISDVCENCTFDAGPFGTLSSVAFMSTVLNATVLRGARVDAEFLRYGTIGKSTLGGGFEDVPDGGLLLSDGISDVGSDPLVSGDPTYISADGVVYVDSATGDDSNDGSACEPLATLAEAISQANSSGDTPVIVLRSSHVEQSTSQIDVQTSLTIVAEAGAAFEMRGDNSGILVTSPSVEVRGLVFRAGAQMSQGSDGFLTVNDLGFRATGCDFLMDSLSPFRAVSVAGFGGNDASGASLESCKFISSASDADSLPAGGLFVGGTADHFTMRDCEFDGGPLGVDFGQVSIGTVLGLRVSGLALKNCSDIAVGSASTGYLQVAESDDTCHVEAF